VAFYGVMKELDKPLRLLADVSDSDKTSREEMLTAADSCFEAIEHGKGNLAPFADDCERHENGGQTTHNKTPIPWPVDLGSPEANRSMAIIGTLSCAAQIDSQVLSFITRQTDSGGRTERPGFRVSHVQPPRRRAFHQNPGRPRRGHDPDGRRNFEPAGRRNLQNPCLKNPRDRGDGDFPALRHEKRLGIAIDLLCIPNA
jgi:hypothetical protein